MMQINDEQWYNKYETMRVSGGGRQASTFL